MTEVAANDLKVSGVKAIERALAEDSEALISVRGKRRFVVMDIDRYQQIREAELEIALNEARADVKAGRVLAGGIHGHIRRITRG